MWANSFMIPGFFKSIDDIRYQIQFELLTRLQPGRFYPDLGPDGTDLTIHFNERDSAPAAPGTAALHMKGVSMRFMIDDTAIYGEDEAPLDIPGMSKPDPESHEFLIFADTGTIRGDIESRSLIINLSDGMWL